MENCLDRQMLHASVLALMIVAAATSEGAQPGAEMKTLNALANAPLYFEARRPGEFVARGLQCNILLTPDEAVLTLGKMNNQAASRSEEGAPAGSKIIRFQFLGSNPQAAMTGLEILPGKANYFIGDNPQDWLTGVPLFSRVQIGEIYPGVSLVYYADESARLEYDIHLQPHVAPERILFRVEGADGVRVDAQGNLVLKIGGGEILQHKPVIYQAAGGRHEHVDGGYRLAGNSTVGFRVGKRDETLPLVIDPSLSFSTYLGGMMRDAGWGIALDANNNIYVAGETVSVGLHTTNVLNVDFTNAYSTVTRHYGGTNYSGSYNKKFGDAFVAKFSSGGSNLDYLTYLGGRGDDGAFGIAVDPEGNAYVTGFTDSTNFPIVSPITNSTPLNSSQARLHGSNLNPFHAYPVDAFVAKIGPNGTNLIYSTYLGGNWIDQGYKIAIDNLGNAYVTGFTESTNFPVTANAFQTNYHGNDEVFVSKIAFDGTNTWLAYSTFLGGTNNERGQGIVVDNNTYCACVVGYTASTNFPTTNAIHFDGFVFTNTVVTKTNGIRYTNEVVYPNFGETTYTNLNNVTNRSFYFDAFVTEISADGSSLVFSSYLGGTNNDVALGVALDANANVYVTGYTESTNFPVTDYHTNFTFWVSRTNRSSDAFVTKLGPGGTNIIYSTTFGGSAQDQGMDIAVDGLGNAYIVGETASTNFLGTNTFELGSLNLTNSAGDRKKIGTNNVFVAEFNANASAVIYSTYLGGFGNDLGYAIKLDSLGNAYIVGQTSSTNFPTTTNAFQQSFGGMKSRKYSDAFIAIISNDPPVSPPPPLLRPPIPPPELPPSPLPARPGP